MYRDLEHPEVTWALLTGYPSWMQPRDPDCEDDWDEDDDFGEDD